MQRRKILTEAGKMALAALGLLIAFIVFAVSAP
jgi:hypothetical protein